MHLHSFTRPCVSEYKTNDQEMAEMAENDVNRLESELALLEENILNILLPFERESNMDILLEVKAAMFSFSKFADAKF